MWTFTDADVAARLDPDSVITAIRDAFAKGFGSVQMPQRLQIDVGPAILVIMPCAIAGDELCGVKMVHVSRSVRPEGCI